MLVQTKLLIPPILPTQLPRPHLAQLLENGLRAGHRLSVVTAPTGSGKTTLLSEWANRVDPAVVQCCWLSLDDQDNDPFRFWSYFIAALETQRPELADSIKTLLQGDPLQPVPVEQILGLLINTLAHQHVRFILVLDDYHVIHDNCIHSGLSYLVEHIPLQLHLAIASRSEPLLDLALLRARGQLTELHLEALSFSEDEAAAFLNSTMQLDLSPDEVNTLVLRSEGWIAGLQLAAIALRSMLAKPQTIETAKLELANFIRTFGGSHRHVMDYLIGEVLQLQPVDIQLFLLRTSILQRLSSPLCDEVLQSTTSQVTLEYLERANLFLVPLDTERHWYRYHALWAEALRARLEREHPESIRPLHGRASIWFDRHGFLAEAVDHSLQAGKAEKAASLIEPVAKAMVMRGEGSTLLNWVDQLPWEIVAGRPELIISKAWAQVANGQLDNIELCLEILSNGAGLTPALQGEIAAIRAMVATVHQDIPNIQQQAELALKHLPADNSQIRGAMLLGLGTATALSGQAFQAVDLLNQAAQESQRSNQPIIYIVAVSTLAQTYEALGQLDQAARLHRQVIALESDPVVGSLPLIGVGYVGLGGILHEHLQFEDAETALQRGLSIGQRWGSPEILIGGYFSLARLRYTQGNLAGALEILDRLEAEFLDSSPLHEHDHIQAVKARIWLAQGQIVRVTAWAQISNLDENRPAVYAEESQHLLLMRILLAHHEPARALELLARIEQNARAGQRLGSLIEILHLKALAHQALGQTELALDILEQALTLGEPQDQRRVFVDDPELLPLLQAYLSRFPQNYYVAGLLNDFEHRAVALQKTAALLSEREMDVLRLIAAGLSNQKIADHLVVAISTVKSHVKSILMKLDAQNRTEAVARARELKILRETPVERSSNTDITTGLL